MQYLRDPNSIRLEAWGLDADQYANGADQLGPWVDTERANQVLMDFNIADVDSGQVDKLVLETSDDQGVADPPLEISQTDAAAGGAITVPTDGTTRSDQRHKRFVRVKRTTSGAVTGVTMAVHLNIFDLKQTDASLN